MNKMWQTTRDTAAMDKSTNIIHTKQFDRLEHIEQTV